MPRSPRVDLGGWAYHILNRANARLALFDDDAGYMDFEAILAKGVGRVEMRILAYVLMPNHWHLVLWPRRDGDLRRFMQWVTLTHTQRLHAQHKTQGHGHIYQGRYKAFLVKMDGHLLTVCRYVERNPVRAGLVRSAENWRWSSLRMPRSDGPPITAHPVGFAGDWKKWVNEPQTQAEETAVARHINRSEPLGSVLWTARAIKRFGLESTVRLRGRPKKGT